MDNGYMSQYNRSVAGVNDDFAAKRTANTFSRGLSQRRHSRSIGDFQQNFRRQTPTFQAGFAHRGLGDSGVYKRAMSRWAGDYSRDLGRMYENRDSDMFQFDMNDRLYETEHSRALDDLALGKATMIANTALNINALKPYMNW